MDVLLIIMHQLEILILVYVYIILSIVNIFYCHQDSHKWTWYRWSDARQEYPEESMVDLMLTNNKNLFMDVKANPSVSCDSGHRMVVAKLKNKKPLRLIDILTRESKKLRMRWKVTTET